MTGVGNQWEGCSELLKSIIQNWCYCKFTIVRWSLVATVGATNPINWGMCISYPHDIFLRISSFFCDFNLNEKKSHVTVKY